MIDGNTRLEGAPREPINSFDVIKSFSRLPFSRGAFVKYATSPFEHHARPKRGYYTNTKS